MASTKELFSVNDLDSFSHQECLVNDVEGCKNKQAYCRIRSLVEDRFIILKPIHSSDVEPGILVVQQWVTDWLACHEEQRVEVNSTFEVKDFKDVCTESDTVALHLEGILCNKHFDEYAKPEAYFRPISWQQNVPSEYSEQDLSIAVKTMWTSTPYIVSTGGLVCFEYADLTMVFSISGPVFADKDSVCCVRSCPAAVLRLTFPSIAGQDAMESTVEDKFQYSIYEQRYKSQKILHCQKNAYEVALSVLSSNLHREVAVGLHSMLLLAPHGSGKSHILSALEQTIAFGPTLSDKSFCIIYITPQSSLQSPLNPKLRRAGGKSESPVKPPDEDYNRGWPLPLPLPQEGKLSGLLGNFLRTIDRNNVYCTDKAEIDWLLDGTRRPDKHATAVGNMCYILLVDGIDEWVSDDSDRDQDTAASIAIRELLYAIASSRVVDCSSLASGNGSIGHQLRTEVCIVGTATSTDSAPMIRLTRPPGFDISRHLYNPTEQDRCDLVEIFLHQLNAKLGDNQHEEENVHDIVSGMSALSMQQSSELPPSPPALLAVMSEYILKLSKLTAGFLPIDLWNLLDKALRYQQVIDEYAASEEKSPGSGDALGHTVIQWQYILKAAAVTPPSRLQPMLSSAFVENVSTTYLAPNGQKRPFAWDDFGGHNEIKSKIKILLNKLGGRQQGGSILLTGAAIDKPKGMVLAGRGGTGKSYLVQVMASEAKMNFLSINSTLLLSKYFGETEENIRKLFASARAVSPCILFFDEFEAISTKRSMDGSNGDGMDGGVGSRVLSTFLNELDGISVTNSEAGGGTSTAGGTGDVLVIVACTDVCSLDPALVRPGRLQYHFVLQALNDMDMLEVVNIQLKTFPGGICDGISPSEIVILLRESASIRPILPIDITTICSNAILSSVKEQIEEHGSTTASQHGGENEGGGGGGLKNVAELVCVSRKHVVQAIATYFGTII